MDKNVEKGRLLTAFFFMAIKELTNLLGRFIICLMIKLYIQHKEEVMIPKPEKRIAEFENRGFGMFIHWGMYSSLAQGEWTLNIHKIPEAQYRKCFEQFSAKDLMPNKL